MGGAQHDAWRWPVLMLSCLLMVGNYYCYDGPAALKSQLQQHFNQLSRDDFEWRFNLLYTVYSLPNMVLPFLGGAFVDKYGTNLSLLLFSSIIFLGQLVFAAGSSFVSLNIMLFGRVIVGLGGECLSVAQETLVISWFKSDELAFALGLNISIARLGSVVNNQLSPLIAEATNVSTALWAGVLACALSVVAVILVIVVDRRAQMRRMADASYKPSEEPVHPIRLSDIRMFRASFWLVTLSCTVVYGCVIPFNSVASSLLMERDFFVAPPLTCSRCGSEVYVNEEKCLEIAASCPSVPPYAWPLPQLSENCTILMPEDQFNCSRSEPWIEDSKINCDDRAWRDGPFTKLYCETKAVAAEKAASLMGIPYMISAILSPLLGGVIDRIGLRAVLALVAPVALVGVHLTLAVTSVDPSWPLILQGVAYSVFAAVLWPSIPLVVEEHHIGTACGVVVAAMNIGLTVFPLLLATLYAHAQRYLPDVELFFASLALVGCLLGVMLNMLDWKHRWPLNGGLLPLGPGPRLSSCASPTQPRGIHEATPLL